MNMKKVSKSLLFERYSHENIHPYSTSTSKLIEEMIKEYLRWARSFSLCDLGCGDGAVIFALHSQGLLEAAEKIVGVDLSSERIEHLNQLKKAGVKRLIGIVSDACSVKQFTDESFDLIICSQVVEHIHNQKALVKEIYRLLKPNGKAYVSSVIRKWPGIWIYRNNGRWVLDPTHVHEYSSKEEFVSLLKENGLIPIQVKVTVCAFPIWDMLIRLLIKSRIISPSKGRELFLSTSSLRLLLTKLRFPILGFYIIEAICNRAQFSVGVSDEAS